MTIMEYIADLKRKADNCECGDQKEGFICGMIINGARERKCAEKFMDLKNYLYINFSRYACMYMRRLTNTASVDNRA